MKKENIIRIKNLKKKYAIGGDFFTALDDINLEVDKGEFMGLVGPSGSGKTTLLNIVGGLDSPSSGDITVLSHSMLNTSHKERALIRRKYMGFIFQSYNLLPVYSVFENIELPLLIIVQMHDFGLFSFVRINLVPFLVRPLHSMRQIYA
mgnify:CR=1 FL=1